jgi:hypothetical protein
MQSGLETEMNFFQYLKQHGYPENSIGREYGVGNNCHVDITILDNEKNIPVQIFEIKTVKNNLTIESGKRQLEKARSLIKNKSIPLYLVFSKNESPFFEVINIDNEEEGDVIEKLDYKTQRTSRRAEEATLIKDKREEEINNLKPICRIISIIIFLIGVVSKIRCFNLDIGTVELALIVLAVGVLLIPYASKIKFLGIEFERFIDKKDQK